MHCFRSFHERTYSSESLNLGMLLKASGIDPRDVRAIRHAFVKVHEETGVRGIHADSTDDEILAYTAEQSASTRVLPAVPPRFWIVFIREGGDRARFWSVVENRAELPGGNQLRYFDLAPTDQLSDLKNRLVIGWRSPRALRLTGSTSAKISSKDGLPMHPMGTVATSSCAD